MLSLIAEIILIGSVLGMLFIFFRRVPALADLPVRPYQSQWRHKIMKKCRLSFYLLRYLLRNQMTRLKFYLFQRINRTLNSKSAGKEDRFKEDYWRKIRKEK